jgi:hypothetical protein
VVERGGFGVAERIRGGKAEEGKIGRSGSVSCAASLLDPDGIMIDV